MLCLHLLSHSRYGLFFFLKCFLGKHTSFGLRKVPRQTSGAWTWVDGSVLQPGDYQNWNTGEPNNIGGNEHCAEYFPTAKRWNDSPCDYNFDNVICERFCDSATPGNDFSIDINPHFIDSKGHVPIEITTSMNCLNTSKIHLCTFYDPLKPPTTVVGTVKEEFSSSITCVAPFLYGQGLMRVSLTILDQLPDFLNATTLDELPDGMALEDFILQLDQFLQNATNDSTLVFARATTVVTVDDDADEAKTKVAMSFRNFSTAEYNVQWDAEWLSDQVADMESDFLISSSVDIVMYWYNQTADLWQIHTAWWQLPNSGSQNVTVNITEMVPEVAASVYTVKVSMALNWTMLEEVLPNSITRNTRGIYDSAMSMLEKLNYACIVLQFIPQTTLLCKIAGFAELAGKAVPLFSAELAQEECRKWIEKQRRPPLTVCPVTLKKAESDDRFIKDYYNSGWKPVAFRAAIEASTDPIVYFWSAAEDSNARSVLVEYSTSTGKSLKSRQFRQGEWLNPVNLPYEDSIASTARIWLVGFIIGKTLDGYLPEKMCCYDDSSFFEILCDIYKYYTNEIPCISDQPGIGTGSGDPHVTTFDGFYYTFNGAGEFWLVRSIAEQHHRRFSVQGRTQPKPRNVAGFCAYALQGFTNSSVVQVELSGSNTLAVFVNGIQLHFDHKMLAVQRFYGATVSGMASDFSKVVVSLQSDIAFTFTASSGFLNYRATIGEYHRNKIIGLMGNFDDSPSNDMVSPDGIVLQSDAGDRRIHYEFGMLWNVSETESLFFYPEGKSHSDFWMPDYTPNFVRPEPTPDAIAYCGTSQACLYDYDVTQDTSIAAGTKNTEEAALESQEVLNETVAMCNPLQRPENGNWLLTDSFFVNSTVTFYCSNGFWLRGPENVTCQEDETWDQPVPFCQTMYCDAVEAPANGEMISTNDSFIIGTEITFQCEIGFDMIGNSSIICTIDSIWNDTVPTCQQIICPEISAPNNGQLEIEGTNNSLGFIFGSNATFSCQFGYSLNGSSQSTCQLNGQVSAFS